MGNYADVLTEVEARLNYHTAQAGRILWGMKFVATPIVEVDGKKDLPSVRQYPASLTESYSASGRMSSATAHGEFSLEFRVATARSDGVPSHWGWVEKVMDCLEIDTAGAVNTNLKSTKPFGVSAQADITLDLTLNTRITVSVNPKPVQRGKRRL